MENQMKYLLVLVIVLTIVYLYVLKGKTSGNVKSVEGFQGMGFVLGNEEIQIEATPSDQVSGGAILSGTIMAYYPPNLKNQKLTNSTISTLNGQLQPQGWVVCDGQNGTPDLRGKFIFTADATTSIGQEGGEKTVSLNVQQMPPHDHYFFSHKNALKANDKHNIENEITPIKRSDKKIHAGGDGDAVIMASSPSGGIKNEGRARTFSGLIAGNTGVLNKTQNRYKDTYDVQPHNNMPPFKALVYIMKL